MAAAAALGSLHFPLSRCPGLNCPCRWPFWPVPPLGEGEERLSPASDTAAPGAAPSPASPSPSASPAAA